jgi:hypothetical protein
MSALAKFAPHVARILLGLVFVVFGLNYFLEFLGPPPPMPERAMAFVGGLMASGYIFPIIKTIEVAAGFALLGNRFVPLALTLLAPIIVNIAAFHFVLAPSYGLPIVLIALELYLAWTYRAAFAPMLRARVAPSASALDVEPTARAGAALGT